jgi:hypothetical protein
LNERLLLDHERIGDALDRQRQARRGPVRRGGLHGDRDGMRSDVAITEHAVDLTLCQLKAGEGRSSSALVKKQTVSSLAARPIIVIVSGRL